MGRHQNKEPSIEVRRRRHPPNIRRRIGSLRFEMVGHGLTGLVRPRSFPWTLLPLRRILVKTKAILKTGYVRPVGQRNESRPQVAFYGVHANLSLKSCCPANLHCQERWDPRNRHRCQLLHRFLEKLIDVGHDAHIGVQVADASELKPIPHCQLMAGHGKVKTETKEG